MDTIVVQPQTEKELKEVLNVLRKMKIRAKLYKEQTKEEILAVLEKGSKTTAAYLKGKTTLREAKDLLNEL